jgi:uncharacterized ferritin-like protein (DUF455 family)
MHTMAPAYKATVDAPVGVTPGAADLRSAALGCWQTSDPATKAAQTRALWANCLQHDLDLAQSITLPATQLQTPGRPEKPAMLPTRQVPSRTPFTLEGRAALLHAIAHIEFNAINLALDAVWRFANMPASFYADWLRVASEEAQHYTLLCDHLHSLGYAYGDFDAHEGLWLMTQRTAGDVVARMALVPRTLEARGLDATPPLQAKFLRAGDTRAADILGIILRDEIGHVAIGNRWYRWLCAQHRLEPVAHYAALAQRYQAPVLRPPFNYAARLAAGFTEAEIALLG